MNERILRQLIKEVLLENYSQNLNEESYQDLFEFLDNKVQPMSMGTAYYVASLNSGMNKKLPNKEPNPMYDRVFKNTRFMFRWKDTFKSALERSGEDREVGPRSGQFEKVEGYDMLDVRPNGALYLPILPTGSEYELSYKDDSGKLVPISKEEIKPYLKPYNPSSKGALAPAFRLLMVDRIAKIAAGGNTWTNLNFKGRYMGPGNV